MILFAHGMEGSPGGAKVRALLEAGLDVVAPDFQGLHLAERVSILEEAARGVGLVLAGSSYGGLAAALVAQRFPDRFKGLLLCAPALDMVEAPVEDPDLIVAPPGLPTVVIHGIHDDVVPVEASRRFCRRSGPHVRLIETDDGHRLKDSLHVIVREARALEEA